MIEDQVVKFSLLEKSTIEGNPRTTLKRKEVAELKRQLARFEDGSSSGTIVSFQKASSLGLEYARLTCELMVREKVFELLTQQYELAKIQEAQEDISFQILDPAIPPEEKSGPKRTFNVLLALVASTMLGIFLAFGAELWAKNKQDFRRILEEEAGPAGNDVR